MKSCKENDMSEPGGKNLLNRVIGKLTQNYESEIPEMWFHTRFRICYHLNSAF